MNKNKNKLGKSDLKEYFINQSYLISTDVEEADSILTENGYNSKDLETEALNLISKLNKNLTQNPNLMGIISWQDLYVKLSKLGISKNLIENKLVPDYIPKHQRDNGNIEKALDILIEIFEFNRKSLIFDDIPQISKNPMRQAFFKKPINSNIHQVKAYSHYAQFIAKAVAVGCKDVKINKYPENINEFKSLIVDNDGHFDIDSILKAVWGLGICIIPLNDSGVFHGASWNINGRHIIVLKQKTNSHAKWIFDLLHELYHVFVHLDESNSSVIEEQEISPVQTNDSIEEKEANAFANGIIFGERADTLARKCVEKAKGKMEDLKRSVIEVAKDENVRVDCLANYIAYRLNLEGNNWWGTANSLQIDSPSPYEIIKNQLNQKINYNHLNEIEGYILSKATIKL